MHHDTPATPAAAYLRAPVLLLMAVATGLCAGSNYFNQPLLHSIAVELQVSDATAALTVTLSQVAYALGLLFLVPLGDKLERRGLAVGLMLLAGGGLFISGYAGSFPVLLVGTVVTGFFSVAAQTMVPMAATLSDTRRSGQAVGWVMSGLLTGILLARSVAGVLSDVGGWSTVYRAAGVAMWGVAGALWWVLPRSRNPLPASYLQTLRSLGSLAAQYPRLRSRSLLGALSFASVSVMFSTMTLLLSGPVYQMSDRDIGLLGLVGVAGALMASVAGRWPTGAGARRPLPWPWGCWCAAGAVCGLAPAAWAGFCWAFWWSTSRYPACTSATRTSFTLWPLKPAHVPTRCI